MAAGARGGRAGLAGVRETEAVARQIRSYDVADLRGTDVDPPRNLASTIAVE